MRIPKKLSIGEDDKGFVAFFVTIMIMIILGIIVLSFSQISNNEVTAALNRDLSTQALYAAESGINDVYSKILSDGDVGDSQTQHCTTIDDGVGVNVYNNHPTIDTSAHNNAEYTCVYLNPTPIGETIDCVTACPYNSYVTLIKSTPPVDTITLQWSSASIINSGCPLSSSSAFDSFSAWTGLDCTSVLRVDLVPFTPGDPSDDTPATLDSNVKTFFLYPSRNPVAATIRYDTGLSTSTYPILHASCATPQCKYTITNLNASPSYYMRIQYYYVTPTITISCTHAGSTPCGLQDSAYQIDVTGYADGIERRISSDISNSSSTTTGLPIPPNFAVQSTHSICKSLILASGTQLYENVPSNKPGDLAIIHTGYNLLPDINPTNPGDFCDPI